MKVISVKCIKKYYPNDIGAISILKSIIINHDIRSVKKVDTTKNRHNLNVPTKRKIFYYPIEKIEEVLSKQDINFTIEGHLAISRERLLDVINKIKGESNVNID